MAQVEEQVIFKEIESLLYAELHPYNTLEEVGVVRLQIYDLITTMRKKGEDREKKIEALAERRKRRKGKMG